jgi:hypothetical protein
MRQNKQSCFIHDSPAWSWRQNHDSDRCATVFVISFVSTVLLSFRHVADIVSWLLHVLTHASVRPTLRTRSRGHPICFSFFSASVYSKYFLFDTLLESQASVPLEFQENAYVVLIEAEQWPRDLWHELSSPSRTLWSWVRIPPNAWLSVCVYSLFVLFCV